MSSSACETSEVSGVGDPVLEGGSEDEDDIEVRVLCAELVSDLAIQ